MESSITVEHAGPEWKPETLSKFTVPELLDIFTTLLDGVQAKHKDSLCPCCKEMRMLICNEVIFKGQ